MPYNHNPVKSHTTLDEWNGRKALKEGLQYCSKCQKVCSANRYELCTACRKTQCIDCGTKCDVRLTEPNRCPVCKKLAERAASRE